jgi:ABC-type polysaccharide/polyol phosphate export permease
MIERISSSREAIVGLIATIVTLGASDTFQKNLEPVVGYVGSVLGSIVISGIIVFAVCWLGKLTRSKSLAIAALLPPTLVVFEQVRRHSVDRTGSELLSLLLAIVCALAVGCVVAWLVTRITGVSWDVAAGEPEAANPGSRMDA